jgi:hypothetical protein
MLAMPRFMQRALIRMRLKKFKKIQARSRRGRRAAQPRKRCTSRARCETKGKYNFSGKVTRKNEIAKEVKHPLSSQAREMSYSKSKEDKYCGIMRDSSSCLPGYSQPKSIR